MTKAVRNYSRTIFTQSAMPYTNFQAIPYKPNRHPPLKPIHQSYLLNEGDH
ncbi:MAG TPA: hypothetical protein VF607_05955 [Verrucomicrobiae bacterium]